MVNFLVFLVKDFALADLFEAMLQGPNQQFVFRARVRGEQRLHQTGQRPDFADCLEFRHGALSEVEQVMENNVFRQQRFGNCHYDEYPSIPAQVQIGLRSP